MRVGLDTHKAKIAVAVAEPGRSGEVRFRGEIANQPEAVRQLLERLAGKHGRLRVCYEAGPCGYGLHRQIVALGHDCTVVAPSLVPRKPGERVKTDRRDALTLARLHRAGELTGVWVPDPTHEAMRDLVRARTAAMEAVRRARQRLQGFLLRHGRVFTGRQALQLKLVDQLGDEQTALDWLAKQNNIDPKLRIVDWQLKSRFGDLTFLQLTFGYVIGRAVVAWLLLPQYLRGELFSAYQLLKERFDVRL